MCVRLLILCTSYTFRLALNGVYFGCCIFCAEYRRRRSQTSALTSCAVALELPFCGFLSFFVLFCRSKRAGGWYEL